MPRDAHQRAAEIHELAGPCFAPAHHRKEDQETGHKNSQRAREHANKACQFSQAAHRKSEKAAAKP